MAKSTSKIQHPSPTPTTAKELYGAAVSCGFPDCYEPPYKFVNGAPALNSQIAHIHARSEGGPRWLATMSPEENQAKENLLILCHFHHGVIDDPANEPDYLADVLRQWKAAQIKLATAAPPYARPMQISDAQAGEVLSASEQRDSALIDRTLPLVKAVTRLLATIEQRRQGPREVAAQWQAELDRWRIRPVGWDPDTGENVYASPSRATHAEYATRIQASLDEVAGVLQPLLIEVETELVAAVSNAADAGPWSSWLRRSISEVTRSATTRDAVASAGDTILLAAINDARKSLDAIVLHLRGMDVAEPPEIMATEESSDPADELMAEHREVLDRSWPFVRVSNRPFDAGLHDELAAQTEFACHLPNSGDFIRLSLPTTALLAAHVARRGSNDDIEAIIAGYAERKPTAAATLLLLNLEKILEEEGRHDLAGNAHKALEGLIEGYAWEDIHEWDANGLASGLMLDVFASVITTETVRDRLSTAAKVSPELGARLVVAVAGTSIQIDHSTGNKNLKAHFRFPREWLPVEDLLKGAEAVAEDVKNAEFRSLIRELKDLRDRGRK
ncbi:hypothetical protein PY310_20210 [Pseudarthrobacter sp. H3Y2-7]|uniref:hypothetical protein n=1 Tax=Pseudarthrobacter naphthalenicus TaxID=3031328 RepID=UPI0023B195D3|nr:hypothetical protein [Pseudarthrobacter sp. H3Y2-7]MDE8670898.1 hypothetical protein [Pseudarthrobacter sp. H3Y2-7]